MALVSNKDIANNSGAGVRQDLNDVFAAVVTNNFGDKAQAGQILPCEFVADSSTTPKKLLIRSTTGNDGTLGTTPTFFDVGNLDEDNLGLVKRAGDTLTGPLKLDDGSGASSPALSFDNDSNTGLYRSGSNRIGFSTAGTQRVEISNSGIDMLNALPIRFQDSSGSPFVSIQSPSSLSGNVALTLPPSIVEDGFLKTDASGNLSFTVIAGVPTGSIFCMAANSVPDGYVKCNGASLSRSTYAALFQVIQTTYGAVDSNHFNVPDLRGEFVRGLDDGRGIDSGRGIGTPQGGAFQSHDHDADANASSSVTDPGHRHTLFGGDDDANSGNKVPTGDAQNKILDNNSVTDATTGISVNTSVTIDIDNEGGSETRPRNLAMLYVIKI
tara:strand:- start:1238 stop:2386 length:1149 start_codon:yes stop_codon:yes gene_type:complete